MSKDMLDRIKSRSQRLITRTWRPTCLALDSYRVLNSRQPAWEIARDRQRLFSIPETFNREDDHVHALIEYPPKPSIPQILNALKGVSSRYYGKAGLPKPKGRSAGDIEAIHPVSKPPLKDGA